MAMKRVLQIATDRLFWMGEGQIHQTTRQRYTEKVQTQFVWCCRVVAVVLTIFSSPGGQRVVDGPELPVNGRVLANIWDHLVIYDWNDAAMILTNVIASGGRGVLQSAEFAVQSRVLANSAPITDTPRSGSVEASVNERRGSIIAQKQHDRRGLCHTRLLGGYSTMQR